MWDGVIETRDFVKHTIQNARFRKTHTKQIPPIIRRYLLLKT